MWVKGHIIVWWMNEIGTLSSFWFLLDLGPLASGSLASGLLSRFHRSITSPFITQSYLAASDSSPLHPSYHGDFLWTKNRDSLVGNWAGPISCLQIQGLSDQRYNTICLFRMLWENYSRRAKVVSLEEQPGRLSWATVNNILLVGWIVTRMSAIESGKSSQCPVLQYTGCFGWLSSAFSSNLHFSHKLGWWTMAVSPRPAHTDTPATTEEQIQQEKPPCSI